MLITQKKIISLLALFCLAQAPVNAALKLDRTRVIFPGNEKSVSLTITNENKEYPYLAQSWLSDSKGNKLKRYLAALPPIHRINQGEKTILRIEQLGDAATLPQDRESLFYYSLREIPPKSNKSNVLQLSLQTKIKVFYRPESILPKKNHLWQETVEVSRQGKTVTINNTTPYYIVSLALVERNSKDLTKGRILKEATPMTIAPFTSYNYQLRAQAPNRIGVVFIDDYGGRPEVIFNCTSSSHCVSEGRV